MSVKSKNKAGNKTYTAIKWQLTAISGAVTTGLIIMLET